jgi:integrase
MQCVDAPGIFTANISNGLRLLARTAVRSIELREATWTEINFDKAEWLIPAERMKMRRPHLVPLSRQALAILREQHQISGDGALIFPGVRSGRPLNDASLGLALKTFVGPDVHTPHGFRVSFSSLANEARPQDEALIELCLAHAKGDRVASVYNRSQRIEERRALMQWWADYIDECKALKVSLGSAANALVTGTTQAA